jgi:hypothetical protein
VKRSGAPHRIVTLILPRRRPRPQRVTRAKARRGESASAEELLRAVVALADDGFCRRRVLRLRFPRMGERELRQAEVARRDAG